MIIESLTYHTRLFSQATCAYWYDVIHVLAPNRQQLIKRCLSGSSLYPETFGSLDEADEFFHLCLEDYHSYMGTEENEPLEEELEEGSTNLPSDDVVTPAWKRSSPDLDLKVNWPSSGKVTSARLYWNNEGILQQMPERFFYTRRIRDKGRKIKIRDLDIAIRRAESHIIQVSTSLITLCMNKFDMCDV